jgi:hypothetical protein
MTKTVKKEPIPKERYPIYFDSDSMAGCCGTTVFYNFTQSEVNPYAYYHQARRVKALESKEAVFAKVESDFFTYMSEQLDGDSNPGSNIAYITLIAEYSGEHGEGEKGTEQIPGLIDYLLEHDWRPDREWINSNGGNRLVQLSREFKFEDGKVHPV